MSYKDLLRSDVIHAGNKISRGHYSPETLASALMKSLGEEAPLKITVPNGSVGLLFEKSAGTASFSFDKDLAEIFGISENKRRHIEQQTLFIPRINYPTIFVHCERKNHRSREKSFQWETIGDTRRLGIQRKTL